MPQKPENVWEMHENMILKIDIFSNVTIFYILRLKIVI